MKWIDWSETERLGGVRLVPEIDTVERHLLAASRQSESSDDPCCLWPATSERGQAIGREDMALFMGNRLGPWQDCGEGVLAG